jgi:translation initiation factor 6 (eIF-6)
MKFIFAFVFLFAVIVGFNIQKPAFRDIEFASFDVNSYRTTIKDSVFIGLYCSINSTGLVKIYNPNDLRDYPKIYYSYQLADNELKKISS